MKNINKKNKSGSGSEYSLNERYFPLLYNVIGFRSRWVWTGAELTQQMTDGGLWNQPLAYDSLHTGLIWSILRYCPLPMHKGR